MLGKQDHAHNWVYKTHSLLTTCSRVESTLGRNTVDKYGRVLFGKDTELFPTVSHHTFRKHLFEIALSPSRCNLPE